MKNLRNDYCLLMFTGNDTYRPAMQKIHSENNKVYATNGHIAIKIADNLCARKYSKVEKYPNIEKIFSDHKPIEKKTFNVDDLFNVLMKIEVCFRPKKIECNECSGGGTLTCDHCDSEYDCKECDGDGVVNGNELELSGDDNVLFFNKKYNLNNFNKIIHTALFTGTENVIVINGEGHGTIFKVGNITILLMSLVMKDENN